ncbi:YlxR family protein [Mycoplasma simbae]|uniref:YlxR family protein n=1 Tax=Mycoplasma simbae TaxID=36744 RepID=UPI000497C3D2|nr:YlxR family protein [Mycoplasma simbae]
MVTRKCIVTGQIKPVDELIRIDFDRKNNQINLDLAQNKKGRGAYFILSDQNWELVWKTKAFNRSFRTNIPREFYLHIEEQLKEAQCLKRTDYLTKKM